MNTRARIIIQCGLQRRERTRSHLEHDVQGNPRTEGNTIKISTALRDNDESWRECQWGVCTCVRPGLAFRGRDIPGHCWTSVFLDSNHQMPAVPLPITATAETVPSISASPPRDKSIPLGPASEPRFVGLTDLEPPGSHSFASQSTFLCLSAASKEPDTPLSTLNSQCAGSSNTHRKQGWGSGR